MKQLSLFDTSHPDDFREYHEANPQIYRAFRRYALDTIRKGFSHYSAKGIFELIRWHTGVAANGEFKINNNYTPHYARMFMNEFPNHTGFFLTRQSKADLIHAGS